LISFTKRLHDPILRGEVTCSVRIWKSCRVKLGGRYPFGHGHVKITGIKEIGMKQITAALARRSGFASLADLLSVAKHGSGANVYLIDFVYEPSHDWLPLITPQSVKPTTTRATKKPRRKSRSA